MTNDHAVQPSVTLPSFYLQQALEVVADFSDGRNLSLAALGITPALLNKEEITLEWKTLAGLLVTIEAVTQHASVGLLIGERLLINSHGSLGYAAMNATTTRQVIDLLKSFLHLRNDLIRVESEEVGENIQLRFIENRPLHAIKAIITEATVLAIRNILDFITLGACPINNVTFAFDGSSQDAEAFFGCQVIYQQTDTTLSIPQAFIDKPLRLANQQAFQSSLHICEQELEKLAHCESITNKIKQQIYRSQKGFPTLPIVARRLYMTPRTLHRRLLNEGTCFRTILDEVRKHLAASYVEDQHMSIKEIAYRLGYSEISNFRKAFKRWYGVAPSHYRSR